MSNNGWIRSAFWIGTMRPGFAQPLQDAMNRVLLRAFQTMPGICDSKACWPCKLEDGPPTIARQFLVEFDSRDELQRMLISPQLHRDDLIDQG